MSRASDYLLVVLLAVALAVTVGGIASDRITGLFATAQASFDRIPQ